jgi:metal-responsive CopG/Arc/MetJ family transcriptional regulator
MPSVKTAISIEEPLYREMDSLAREMKVSRSSLFSRAVSEYLQNHKNWKLFEDLNRAYGNPPDTEEKNLIAKRRSRHRKLVRSQW